MDLRQFYESEWSEHLAVANASRGALAEPFRRLALLCVEAVRGGHKILLFGNGGSAADAQHLAAELVVRYKSDRAPIAAIALTTDSSILSATGNDMGFDQLFARQIRALGQRGDVALGISTSGRSPNVLNALKVAREMGLSATAFSGGDGGALSGLADPLLLVPSKVTARIQEMHITIGQMLCGAIESELGLV